MIILWRNAKHITQEYDVGSKAYIGNFGRFAYTQKLIAYPQFFSNYPPDM